MENDKKEITVARVLREVEEVKKAEQRDSWETGKYAGKQRIIP